MQVVPWVLVAVLLIGLLVTARRTRQRTADSEARLRREIVVGTSVMTTSGLYGAVVAINPDDTVILAISPGVEVRWALAALRDAVALPARYRRPVAADTGKAEDHDEL